jgi:putative endopeptidase
MYLTDLKPFYLLVVAGVLIFSSCKTTIENPSIDLNNFDKTHQPGDDFYRYVNGGWLANNPIPDDYSRYGSFEQLAEQNEEKLLDLLTGIKNDQTAQPGSNRQKIRDFYNSAMDTLTQNHHGIQPILVILDRIEKLDDKKDMATLVAWLHHQGIRPLFGINASQDRMNTEQMIASISQGGIGMTDRDYYINQDPRSLEIKKNYELFIEKIFSLAGSSESESHQARITIMNIESQLAEASMTRLERRDPYATYNKMPLEQLSQLTPLFSWDEYLIIQNLDISDINVSQPLFFQMKNQLLQEISLDDWKTYLKWNVLRTVAPYIGQDFDDAQFAFYGTVMTGSEKQRERWKRSLTALNSAMGEAVGQEYVALHFPPQAKERMIDLVEHLRAAFRQRIGQLNWMSDVTKQNAFEKLQMMNVKIGYPDKWIDYTDLEIKDQPYVLNILATMNFNIQRNLSEIGQPVDRGKWFMSPQTVNAYYSPTMNEIVFPAAILQPPFFYMDGDDAVNFGAIGMVIGHEMTHGFDDQGRRYAPDGNLRDWWTQEDNNLFEARSKVLVEQYNNYVMLDSLTINGKLSLGENIADLGGVTIAYQALQNKLDQDGRPGLIDRFTPEQRFFISYAQIWRNHMRDQRLMQQLSEGPHSPGEARVNGIVYNLEEFYQAFGIEKQNSKRYIKPEMRAQIW